MNEDLKKLSIDLYNNKNLVFNETTGDEAMRNIVAEAIGQKAGEPINYYSFEKNKVAVFEILSIAIDAVLPLVLTNQFDALADVRNVNHGDKPRFDIEDNSLLRVGVVASGTQDLARQELFGSSFTVETDWYGAKIYAELERFLAGEINWQAMINRVAASFSNKMQGQIYEAFAKSYDGLRATRKQTGTYDEEKLLELADVIGVASGGKSVAVYGTPTALRAVSKVANASDGMKDQINKVGYLGTVAGVDLMALPQVFKSGKEEFAIDNKTLLVLPKGEKIVSVVLEGQAIVKDEAGDGRSDMQKEFLTMKRYGLQVAQLATYGMYKMS